MEKMQRQSLYNTQFEKDSCGTGALVHLKNEVSHTLVDRALHMLEQMFHRGGTGIDQQSGDGAGILIRMPHRFFTLEAKKQGITLPQEGSYAVLNVFLPQAREVRDMIENQLQAYFETFQLPLLFQRDVPVDERVLGVTSYQNRPSMVQYFIRIDHIGDELEKLQKLYILRRTIEREGKDKSLYIVSCSHRTIIYKGMLNSYQVRTFYEDLNDPTFESSFALIHSRFSTNTFPSWDKAHPYRYLSHNGELNTIAGNRDAAEARSRLSKHPFVLKHKEIVFPVLTASGSDSMQLDEYVEFLHLCGRELPEILLTLIPEAFENKKEGETITPELRAFYRYQSTRFEAWDGPANITFTDGKRYIGATLDRNGLRPSRYTVTTDNYLVLASETGVLDIPAAEVAYKGRLEPGKLLLVDLEKGEIVSNDVYKKKIAEKEDYTKLLTEIVPCTRDYTQPVQSEISLESSIRQRYFGVTEDFHRSIVTPMIETGDDAVGSMGDDTPLAILSEKKYGLNAYFRQRFAQVTNPPLDAIREKEITSTVMYLGGKTDVTQEASVAKVYELDHPILLPHMIKELQESTHLKTSRLSLCYTPGGSSLEQELDILCERAYEALQEGSKIIILSDEGIQPPKVSIPIALAGASIHHFLLEKGERAHVSIVAHTGEVLDVHSAAVCMAFGIEAISPYLAFEYIAQQSMQGKFSKTYAEAIENYEKAMAKGLLKVASKIGISTLQSFCGAKTMEALGISRKVCERYLLNIHSPLDGISLEDIEMLQIDRMEHAKEAPKEQDFIGKYISRKNGEEHLYNPKTIRLFQTSIRTGNYETFKRYTTQLNDELIKHGMIRGQLCFDETQAIAIEEVEPIENIIQRFRVSAMSYGALSEEAHTILAKAMNGLKAQSNSGEGGESRKRYITRGTSEDINSAIKQVSTGRFGVDTRYLLSADELQIKAAQGAKPGEGGQLPGKKVYPWIAEARGTVPGVMLISPPPHHDIYSIEDIEQLIFDLKNVNPKACISVKLASESGVGTVAAGVVKARAEKIIISGSDGGTGAAARSSIFHAALPWEIGLAEAHQTLQQNGLRERIRLEVDGKLMSGRDVVVGALLGAEEYGFGTLPLIALGCVMARVCHMDTCPVGVTSQNPKLREKLSGTVEHVQQAMRFLAMEVQEYMAKLGFRTMEEMIGRSDKLRVEKTPLRMHAHTLDLKPLLHRVAYMKHTHEPQHFDLENTIDVREIYPQYQSGNDDIHVHVTNTDRSVLAYTGARSIENISPLDRNERQTKITVTGTAGQSFAAFLPEGFDVYLKGDANDYIGKGLSGATLTVCQSDIQTEASLVIGNVAFFGATSGQGYINGSAGERFAVRNSGSTLVVEGIGDHGCEYMTAGVVVVLGEIGSNFGAGMSGGIAYLYKPSLQKINKEMLLIEELSESDVLLVEKYIDEHIKRTQSIRAQKIRTTFKKEDFKKIIPRDYKHITEYMEFLRSKGYSEEEVQMGGFTNQFQK